MESPRDELALQEDRTLMRTSNLTAVRVHLQMDEPGSTCEHSNVKLELPLQRYTYRKSKDSLKFRSM